MTDEKQNAKETAAAPETGSDPVRKISKYVFYVAAFLFVWVQSLRDVGMLAFWAMVIFLAVLVLGWAYAWRKGALEWV